MACLRKQTLEGRRGTVHCDEEGCEFAWVETGRDTVPFLKASEADCLLQLRLRTGDSKDTGLTAKGRIWNPVDKEYVELEFDLTPAQHKLLTEGVTDKFSIFNDKVEIVKVPAVQVDPRPCKGVNSNICVAEGCYGESCRELPNDGPRDSSVLRDDKGRGIDIGDWIQQSADLAARGEFLRNDTLQRIAELRESKPEPGSGDYTLLGVFVEIATERGWYDKQTPREEFESQFGSITDDQWQWLKEFCKRHPVTGGFDITYDTVRVGHICDIEGCYGQDPNCAYI